MRFSKQLLFMLALLGAQLCFGQKSFLFLKKNGGKIKTWMEGDRIKLELNNGDLLDGVIYLLRNDSIYVQDYGLKCSDVKQVIIRRKEKKPFPIDGLQFLYITGGVALSTIGMTASKWEPAGRALLYSSAIGYGPVLISAAARKVNLKRKGYRIGRKFKLQVLDFYMPEKSDLKAF